MMVKRIAKDANVCPHERVFFLINDRSFFAVEPFFPAKEEEEGSLKELVSSVRDLGGCGVGGVTSLLTLRARPLSTSRDNHDLLRIP